jgi:hypothetical protein
MMMRSALYKTNTLNFYSAGSLKQQFVGRHNVPNGHIIFIPNPLKLSRYSRVDKAYIRTMDPSACALVV